MPPTILPYVLTSDARMGQFWFHNHKIKRTGTLKMKKGHAVIGGFLACAAVSALMVGCAGTPAPRFVPPKPDPNLIGIPENISNVFKNAHEICGPITGGAKNAATEGHIQRFRSLLGKSATGARMLENAASVPDGETGKMRPLWVCFEKMTGSRTPYAYYSWGRGVMAINTHMFDYPVTEGKQISAAIHELRHAEQDKAFQAVRYQNKEDAIISTYASEADAEAVNILVQWEMKEAGYSVPWYIRATPDNFMQGYFCFADMHRAFEKAVQNGGDKMDATRAAFRAWHENKPVLQSYQGQGHMRWGMQEVRDEQKKKHEALERERVEEQKKREELRRNSKANANGAEPAPKTPRLAPRLPPDVFIPHSWATCSLPRTEIEAALELPVPSQKLSDALDEMGILPDGSGNYLKAGGGVRKILQAPLP
jgi:hypothetical protein